MRAKSLSPKKSGKWIKQRRHAGGGTEYTAYKSHSPSD